MIKTVNTDIIFSFINKPTFFCPVLLQSLLQMKNKETINQLTDEISEYSFDETSSESSEGGRRFLKNPEKRVRKSVVRKQSPATTEDERTEDLLTPFCADKTSLNYNKYSTQKISSGRPTNSEVEKHLVNSNVEKELSVVQKYDENDLNRISVLSFNDKDSLVDASIAPLEGVRTESRASTISDHLILFVDELMNESIIDCGSYRSTSRFDKSCNEKSLMDVEEVIECENSCSSRITADSSNKKTPLEIFHQVDSDRNTNEADEYSDDFEDEHDPVSSIEENMKYSFSATQKSSLRGETNKADHSNNSKVHNSVSTSSYGHLNKTDLRETASSKKMSKDSAKTPQKYDAKVQTVWSGDFPQYYNVPHVFPVIKHETLPNPMNDTPLKMQSITSSFINYKTLHTLTTYNPCLTALDNMLKQQINLTREFLTTQRNLHETISKAINYCVVTNNYNQTERIMQTTFKRI
ncbi:unnamed protein product [Schistosoma turkestanicum]|nr:unnamed protein product [Schistosoma turkestanicum]